MKRLLLVVIALGVVVGLMSTASASRPRNPKLVLDSCYLSNPEIGWVQGKSSPLDGNNQALSIRTGVDECAFAYEERWGLDGGELVTRVKNLSFDFLDAPDGYVNAGAPRFSVDIDVNNDGLFIQDPMDALPDDVSAFLAAFHCEAPLTEGWARADFTGRKAPGCTIFVGAETFTSDGTNSAWKNLATAHPTWEVWQAPYIIVDEMTAGTPAGRVLVDRIAIQNRMQSAQNVVRWCRFESSC